MKIILVNFAYHENLKMIPYSFLGREITYLINLIREVMKDYRLSIKTKEIFEYMLNTINKIKDITKNDAQFRMNLY